MSGTTTNTPAAENAEPQMWNAKLVRGRYFATPKFTWDNDDPKFRETGQAIVTVDEATKVYLETTAVDEVPVGNEGTYQRFPKFEFEVVKKPDRSRQRAA